MLTEDDKELLFHNMSVSFQENGLEVVKAYRMRFSNYRFDFKFNSLKIYITYSWAKALCPRWVISSAVYDDEYGTHEQDVTWTEDRPNSLIVYEDNEKHLQRFVDFRTVVKFLKELQKNDHI